ncbi:MAG TPA: tetratricopeptide repeat protein [Chthoniobacterales bacterium]
MTFRSYSINAAVSLIGCVALAATARAEPDAAFARANQEYAQGKFQEAIGDYENMARSGEWTAALFYNLGNAYFRTHDFGRAVLQYERALSLEPNHPEAQANLRIARDEARALELLPSWPERFIRFASPGQYAIAGAVLFWIGAFLFAAAMFSQRRRRRFVVLSICSLAGAAVLAYVLIAMENGGRGGSLAIVTKSQIQARLATADTSAAVLALPAGSEVRIEQQRGDWAYAVLPNNLRGWIPAASVERVRL